MGGLVLIMRRATIKIGFLLFLLLFLPSLSFGRRFFEDDPLWKDPDQIPIPTPEKVTLSDGYDFYKNMFGDPGGKEQIKAQNANTMGAVPDSSWFTNRMGQKVLSIEELVNGPNRGSGPDTDNPLTIITSKRQGILRGFTIQDSKGDIYFVKFDPPGYPQLTTSAEVISTKFFHAFGYNVPENYITFIHRDQLRIGPDARVPISKSQTRKMNEKDIDEVWEKVPLTSDGRIQGMASLLIPGEIVGKFRYYGTRPDDANDIFPHQDRRELRGLRVFAAWLNHDEVGSPNTLDTYITENDANYIKHYLLDFGATLGSGTVRPKARRAGNEYYVEFGPIFKSAASLGLWDRPWRSIKYPDYPSIGRIESTYFQPENWKPDYPNSAFLKMDNVDAFWATQIVMRFNDNMIRAIVQSGELIDKEAEAYLIRTLIERRDKIIRYYLSQVNPLDEFVIEKMEGSHELVFRNLGELAGFTGSSSYQYQWYMSDNNTLTLQSLGQAGVSTSPRIRIPDSEQEYLMVRIQTENTGQLYWKKNIEVYIRNGNQKVVVGVDREQ